ncbi:outer membrane protein [Pelagibacterium montanilacus]|uniref:outer membrane protein n=1 Tax=Pelagibacterium montanilacus TaxID=2185280 RepID=UPI000F8D3253|nr:hypothetical protein [Pelagibacterium montanilacus]
MNLTRKFAVIIACLWALGTGPALGQDYGPYGYGAGGGSVGVGFDWEGFYSGVYGGGVPMGDDRSYIAGVFAGVNAQVDSALLGVEAQLGGDFGDDFSLDAMVMGRGGAILNPDLLVYGTVGTGLVKGDFGYAFGGGAEYGVTDYLSVRGEALGTGEWGNGPDTVRLGAGLAFHL